MSRPRLFVTRDNGRDNSSARVTNVLEVLRSDGISGDYRRGWPMCIVTDDFNRGNGRSNPGLSSGSIAQRINVTVRKGNLPKFWRRRIVSSMCTLNSTFIPGIITQKQSKLSSHPGNIHIPFLPSIMISDPTINLHYSQFNNLLRCRITQPSRGHHFPLR
jgi:hypothetical protein